MTARTRCISTISLSFGIRFCTHASGRNYFTLLARAGVHLHWLPYGVMWPTEAVACMPAALCVEHSSFSLAHAITDNA